MEAFPVSKPRPRLAHESNHSDHPHRDQPRRGRAIAYGSYRERERSNDLEGRIVALEHTSTESASEIERLTADKVKLCRSVDIVRQKITGVVLNPGSPTPNFDVQADPLSAPERTILMLYNWCHPAS